jgi:hypothetical protein
MRIQFLGSLLAPDEPLGQRIAILAVCLAFGAWMIFIGRHNVRTREAEESGKRAALLSVLGKSTSMKGRSAVAMGWLRIVAGAIAIVFGFVFFFFGAFLKE